MPDDICIRAAAAEDVAALAALAARTFPLACPPSTTPDDMDRFIAERLSPGAFAAAVVDGARRVLVAADASGALVGYTVLVAGEPSDPEAAGVVTVRPAVELSKCYVEAGRHGAGVAAALMTASLMAARDLGAAGVWLGVNQHNVRAQRFYAKSGFVVVGTKHFTVGAAREDDYVMERPL